MYKYKIIQRQVRGRYIIYYMMNVSKDTISNWWIDIEPVPVFSNSDVVPETNKKLITLLVALFFGVVGGFTVSIVVTSATLAIAMVFNPVLGTGYFLSVIFSLLVLLHRRV